MATNIDKLTEMQKQLMEKVPHGVRPEIYAEMACVKDIMEKSLLFLTSLGHKPWRPNPLPDEEQAKRLEDLSRSFEVLNKMHGKGYLPDMGDDEYDTWTRKLISGFGIIEETLEYLTSVQHEEEPNQLEELTDILFFYLEQTIQSGFTWADIEAEYIRKHAVNLQRYADAEKGDYAWDKREGADKL